MTDTALLSAIPVTGLDLAAVLWFLAASIGYQTIAGLPSLEKRSVVGAVQVQRLAWMRNMATRENRMMDAVVMTQLGQGNAFFASTSAIAIGGLAALVGAGAKLVDVLRQLPFTINTTAGLVEIKTLLLMAIFVYAFFKFAWAFRLSHYCGIMIGAAPASVGIDPRAQDAHAVALARLIGIAADHANNGIRSFYYAISAMAWYFHPLLFIAATTWVLLIMIRRDFFSRSRRVVAAAGGMV